MNQVTTERRGAKERAKNDLACTPLIRGGQKEWFANLREQVADGAHYVYADAMSPHEIFEAFDLPCVINEWWSGIVAARRQSAYYFDQMEAHGFHSGLERYAALGLATVLDEDNPDPPWGGLPKPAFTCSSFLASRADGVARWELLSKQWDVPYFPFEVPGTGSPMAPRWWETSRHGWEKLYPAYQLDRVHQAIWDLIRLCERTTGRKFDMDKLREVMARANLQQTYFEKIRDISRAGKAVVSISEQLGNVMTIQWRRGSEWATESARIFSEEVEERARNGQWICPNETYRLMWMGAGMWQNTSFYRAFEESHGAVFVRSMYMSIAIDGYPRYGNDPVRALAARYCGIGLGSLEWDIHEAQSHHVDGVVSVSSTLGGRTRSALEAAGLPILALDVDLVDGRTWDEGAVRRAMEGFLDTLGKKKGG